MADDDVTILAEVLGWTVDGRVATYRPAEEGWAARVVKTTVTGHAYTAWHVAVIDPGGTARYTRTLSRLVDARVLAERQVRGRNA